MPAPYQVRGKLRQASRMILNINVILKDSRFHGNDSVDPESNNEYSHKNASFQSAYRDQISILDEQRETSTEYRVPSIEFLFPFHNFNQSFHLRQILYPGRNLSATRHINHSRIDLIQCILSIFRINPAG